FSRDWSSDVCSSDLWHSQQTLSLGLDLRGGSQLLLALDETTLLQQEHQRLADEAARLLREQRIGHGQISVSDRQFSLPLRDSQRAQEAVQLLQQIGRASCRGRV